FAELDALRQRQVARVVDGVGGAAHVVAPGVGTGFAAAARFFFTTEGAADFRAGRADVDVGNAAVGTGGRQEGFSFAQVVGEDGGRQALGHAVLQGKRVGKFLVAHHVQDGRESLVADDVGLARHFGDGGAHVP